MPTRRSDQLLDLIKSLSKGEKRAFKLFARRLQSNEEVMFVQLFDVLDKLDEYDETVVRKKLGNITKAQLTNVKRHLYNQLLKSLRLVHTERNIDMQIREQLDHARILYEKGLFIQALRVLHRTREKSASAQDHLLQLEVVEFIKYIEERHITRSRKTPGKMENLLQEADTLERSVSNIVRLSNLKIRIHGLYITMGFARNQKDHYVVKEYFHSELEKINTKPATVTEQVFLHQSYMWYYYILLDFERCHYHAREWVRLFDENPELKNDDPSLYMRGQSYVLTTLFNLKGRDEYLAELRRFEDFIEKNRADFSITQDIIRFMYLYVARINKHLLFGTYQEGLALIDEIEEELKKYATRLDLHRIMVFNYKIALLLFGAGNYSRAIDYLNKIIQTSAGHLREDIQCYARLLHLIAHYEMGHYDLIPYLTESVSRFFDKMEDLNDVQRTILNFFRQGISASDKTRKAEFLKLQKAITKLSKDPYERRAFHHLDILEWIEGKVKDSERV